MKKKSQITIFIILSIILVVSATGVYTFKSSALKKESQFFESDLIKPEYDKFKGNILQCSESSAIKSVDSIGIRGGYYKKPQHYLDFESDFIPFYYYQGEVFIPGKTEIEKQLCDSYKDEIIACIKNINKGFFSLSYKEPKVSCRINENNILFENNMKISIEKDKNIALIDMKKFPVVYDSLLSKIIELSAFITDLQKDKNLCITCISSKAGELNLYVNLFSFKNSTNIFIISENTTSNEPYYFEFLSKYTEEESKEYIAPELPDMPIAG